MGTARGEAKPFEAWLRWAAAPVAAALVTLSACSSETGEEFAHKLFPDLEFEQVLAAKLRHKGGHGCTYIVLKLPQDADAKPPDVAPQWAAGSFERDGAWRPTPVIDSRKELGPRQSCLVGDPYQLDGARIDGYGQEILDLIRSQGAWVSIHGRGEGQVMMLYAPDARLAFHLRYGD